MVRPTSGPMARGAEAFKSGNFAAAVDAYSEALAQAENAEDRAAALSNRAQCHLRLGNLLDGREDAAAARALAPENPKAWYRLGICEARLSNLPESEVALEEAASLRPGDRDLAEALALVRRRRAEANGKYAWTDIYQSYLAPGEADSTGPPCPAAVSDPSSGVLTALGVEPFVGPIRVGFSEGRGRGLFATEDVPAGRLLLCAQAVVTGENDKLPGLLADSMGRSAELREAVLLLSHGTPASEGSMPSLDLARLAAPRRLLLLEDASNEADATEVAESLSEELKTILYYNQFSLPRVNPNAAPIEVQNDFARSGLWLLPSFVNHSCRPSVQRVIVRDCLFLRACRDLREGDELLDCYIETLQPLARRAASLASFGMGDQGCGCERCRLEAAVLDAEEVRAVVEQAGKTKEDPNDDNAAIAAKAEVAAMQAEAVVARSLERSLAEGRLPELPRLPPPEAPLSAQRAAALREGIERFADAAEEESFRRQERLHRLLLAGLANVVRSHAMSLRGLNQYVDQSAAWSRVSDLLEEVIPCSELSANVSNEAFSSKLLAFHLDHKKACRAEFRRALLQTHLAYSGGAAVWRLLNKQGYAASVLDGADPVWAALKQEFNFPDDSLSPVVLPAPAEAARPQVGFEDLLKRRAKEERRAEEAPQKAAVGVASAKKASGDTAAGKAAATGDSEKAVAGIASSLGKGGADAPASASGAAQPLGAKETSTSAAPIAPATDAAGTAEGTGTSAASTALVGARPASAPSAAPGVEERAPGGSEASARGSGAQGATASYQVVDSGPEELSVVVSLPGLTSGAEASLQVSERELCVRSERSEHPHALDIPLPRPVDPSSSAAKWSKRAQQLTIRLRAVGGGSPGTHASEGFR